MKNSSLVILERFYDPSAAYIVRGLLHSYGIESYVFDEHVNTTAYHLQFSVGGVRLMVHADDVERASEIIKEHQQHEKPAIEVKPKTVSLWRILLSLTLTIFSGAPTPLKKRKHK